MTKYNTELVTDMARQGKPLSADENTELFALVSRGDREARKRMIEGNMSLVVTKVDAHVNCFPKVAHLRDDLTSAGFIGLVKAVNHIAAGKVAENENITGFISVSIQNGIGDLADTEIGVCVPRHSRVRARVSGRPIQQPDIIYTDLDTSDLFRSRPDIAALEMRDLIDSCCECREERQFIALREKGYKLAEIAEAIGMPLSSTHVMKQDLYRRVLAKAGLRHIAKGKKGKK
jgi:hypothetical protein